MSIKYEKFIAQIHQKLGINLKLYKKAQMKRRLTSLRNKRNFDDFDTYYRALTKDDELLEEFIDRITINVSEFYRNPKRWEVLENKIFPLLLQNKQELNIWSAACSTGEEPYSLALMLKEIFPHVKSHILATDIDETALDKARQGVYKEHSLKSLPLPLKNKYFSHQHGLYHIDAEIKENITFRKHDLLADDYPKNIDLIVCRNVLIYFTEKAKNMIYENFSKSLAENGILFVGSTEQIFRPHEYNLSLADTFFYQRQDNK